MGTLLQIKKNVNKVNASIEFSLNVFTEFDEFSDKIFVTTVKGLEPAYSYVKDQHATAVLARHM